MNIRKSLAVVALAGAVSLGYAGVAGAQPTTTDPAPTSPPVTQPHKFNCESAKDHLARIQHRLDQVKDRITKVEARIDKLRQNGHNDEADRLAKRVESAKDRLTKVEARLDKVTAKVHERCDTAAPAASN